MKKKVKRYAGQDKSLVEIEERSIKTPRLIEEEKAKAPMDYAGLGGRARATSMMSGPVLDIKEEKTETESEAPKGIAAGFDAKRYLEESESKGGGPRSETKPAVAKKAVAKKSVSTPKYEDTGAKIGSQGNFKFEQPKDTSRGLRLAPGSVAEKIAGKLSDVLDRSQRVGAEAMKESGRQARVDRIRRNVGSNLETYGMKKGGKVSSASSRADGIAQRGKTKGRIC